MGQQRRFGSLRLPGWVRGAPRRNLMLVVVYLLVVLLGASLALAVL